MPGAHIIKKRPFRTAFTNRNLVEANLCVFTGSDAYFLASLTAFFAAFASFSAAFLAAASFFTHLLHLQSFSQSCLVHLGVQFSTFAHVFLAQSFFAAQLLPAKTTAVAAKTMTAVRKSFLILIYSLGYVTFGQTVLTTYGCPHCGKYDSI